MGVFLGYACVVGFGVFVWYSGFAFAMAYLVLPMRKRLHDLEGFYHQMDADVAESFSVLSNRLTDAKADLYRRLDALGDKQLTGRVKKLEELGENDRKTFQAAINAIDSRHAGMEHRLESLVVRQAKAVVSQANLNDLKTRLDPLADRVNVTKFNSDELAKRVKAIEDALYDNAQHIKRVRRKSRTK